MYYVWTKEEFGDLYKKTDCPDLSAARAAIDTAIRGGGKPILTVEVGYAVGIVIGEETHEATPSKTITNQGAGGEGNGTVRPGDEENPE